MHCASICSSVVLKHGKVGSNGILIRHLYNYECGDWLGAYTVLNGLKTIFVSLLEIYYFSGPIGSSWVGWLDNLKIRLNSVQLGWNLTQLGKAICV